MAEKSVAVYMRVSTKEQELTTQDSVLTDYCKKREWNIYKKYTDRGISGAKDSRPELNKLKKDAKRKKFDIVLVYRYDRFARSTQHLINSLADFESLNIDLDKNLYKGWDLKIGWLAIAIGFLAGPSSATIIF